MKRIVVLAALLTGSAALANNYPLPQQANVSRQMINNASRAIGISNAIGHAILTRNQGAYNRAVEAGVALGHAQQKAYFRANPSAPRPIGFRF